MTVYLVGAGPGDPELITVKGKRLLEKAQCVVYDRLANPELLRLVPESAIKVSAGKGPGSVDLTQDEINAKLVELGKSYEIVVRLKGGDPFVFGRGGEEAQVLIENSIEFEVVPGITSAISAPAYAGIPITQRAVATNFTVVTGHEDPTKDSEQVKWADLAKVDGTLAILMGIGNRKAIADALIAGGKKPDCPVAVIRNGTRGDQNTLRCTLAELGDADVKSPSVIVVGEVAGIDLAWFENKPLFGKSIAVTRAREQQSQITSKLQLLGAQVVEAPSISIEKCDFEFPDLDDVTYVVFTSTNGVLHTMNALFESGRDVRYFANCALAAIGQATADELMKYGLKADIVPSRFVAEELLELFPDSIGSDPIAQKVVCFRASEVRDVLEVGLIEKGYEVINVDVYKTLIAEVSQQTIEQVKSCDAITFASSSTVKNACKLFGLDVVKSIPVKVSIGPVTSKTMRDLGIEVTIESDPHTIDGVVDSLVDSFVPNRV